MSTKPDPMALTVQDINAINRLLESCAPSSSADGSAAAEERKRIADLEWKLVALGQRIESAAKQPSSAVRDSAETPFPPATQPICPTCAQVIGGWGLLRSEIESLRAALVEPTPPQNTFVPDEVMERNIARDLRHTPERGEGSGGWVMSVRYLVRALAAARAAVDAKDRSAS